MKKDTFLLFALFAFMQLNAQSIVIGTGTASTAGSASDPVDGYFEAFRYQVVYTAAELKTSLTPYDQITALGFSVDEDYGGGNLIGYTIKMGHTTEVNSAIHNINATTIVKNPFAYNPTVTAAGSFDMITFDTPFIWNGTDNIIIDICSDGPNPFVSPYGGVRGTTIANGSRRYRQDGGTACDVPTATINGIKPNIKFNYTDGSPPACVAPTGLVANSVTSSSANLTWNAVSGSVNYQYVLNTTAANPGGAGTTITGTNFSATSLTQSTVYYFHLRNNCGASGFSTWSTISFTTPTSPPVNDTCSSATSLTVSNSFANGAKAGTILGATTTSGLTPSCQSSVGDDVWYSVIVPTTGSMTIEIQSGATNGMTDSVIAAYSGTCSGLTQVGCDDDSGTGNMSLLSIAGRVPGSTLYIAVWKFGTGTSTNDQFQIAAYDVNLATDSFNNDSFAYYPNPVKNVLNLSYSQNISDVRIYNLLGQEVMMKTINANRSQIDMTEFLRSTYVVKITSDNQVKTIRVIKE
ncbi:T9SS type A sorting domain-containing protein [Flavobacterium sp. GT3R68]|uniref:T9SS type A sorting domain-containing protein n=1 Tax=Flavobacterium sp. GT3R68 TaxID=2594437 RepID=UPI000F880CD6|nr:T9SS type A sorting domain-containing protein [Flavobacterium sp. GT3R68]RTY95086.1 T9SS type A sorting domain-containing protein [Flavobacterium sp. GSN2]TRW91892.1 T9SS type A sorting domain-containing protein [Flavobacterium sp. GT3R68]